MLKPNNKYNQVYEQAYANLDETQRTAVDHTGAPVMLTGGPGTGKTQVLCIRVAGILLKATAEPGSILCLTNRDDAAMDIRQCLLTLAGPHAYEVNVYSFDSFCREIIQDNPFLFQDIPTWPSSGFEEISPAKTYRVDSVVKAFEEHKNLLAWYQAKFTYILIEEYEDTGEIQSRLVALLTGNREKPNLFVSGDDDQAIYPGAVSRFAGFARFYPKYLFTVVLRKNYRSVQPIIDVAKSLISLNAERFINLLNPQGEEPGASFHQDNKLTQQPVMRQYETRQDEMIDITVNVQQLIAGGISPHHIAVIYREHKYGEQLAEHFSIKNLPVYSRRLLNILEMPFVRKITRMLRYLAAELDRPYSGDNLLFEILHFDFFNIPPIEIARIAVEVNEQKYQGVLTSIRKFLHDKINTPAKTLFDVPLHAGLATASRSFEKLIGETANVNLQTLLEKVVRESGVLAYIDKSNSKEWLLMVLTALLDFAKDETLRNPGLDLSQFLDNMHLMQKNRISLLIPAFTGSRQSLHLLNVEDCKGLEFEYVFLAGCNASAWDKINDTPAVYRQHEVLFNPGMSAKDAEHTRRMFYVALTRARSFLHISFANSGTRGNPLEPSRFIIEILRRCELEVTQITIDKQALTEFQALHFRGQVPQLENTGEEFIKRIVSNFVMSVTALNNFLRCPLEFYFKNIIRLPAGKSEAAEFGSAIHFAIQRLFEKMKADPHEQFPSTQEMIEDFTWYMNRQQSSFTREGFDRRLEHGKEVLINYYERYVDTWPRIVAVELNIRNVVLRGVPLKGKVDKLEFDGRNVNVVDYKSGDMKKAMVMLSPPSDEMPNGGDYWRQAVFYKILVDHYGGKGWKATGSQIDFVEPGENGQYEKHKIDIRPEDVETVSQQIVQVWERIQQHDFYTGCGREECLWCGMVG